MNPELRNKLIEFTREENAREALRFEFWYELGIHGRPIVKKEAVKDK